MKKDWYELINKHPEKREEIEKLLGYNYSHRTSYIEHWLDEVSSIPIEVVENKINVKKKRLKNWTCKINGEYYLNLNDYCSEHIIDIEEFNEPVEFNPTVKNISWFFNRCSKFNQPVLIPDEVINCEGLFYECHAFNSPVTFNPTKTKKILTRAMFESCESFNQPIQHIIDLIDLKSINLTDTFANCASLKQKVVLPALIEPTKFKDTGIPFIESNLFEGSGMKDYDISFHLYDLPAIWFILNQKGFDISGYRIVCTELFNNLDLVNNELFINYNNKFKTIFEMDNVVINLGEFINNKGIIDVPADVYARMSLVYNLNETEE